MNRSHHALLCLVLSNGLIGILIGCARQPIPMPQGDVNAKNRTLVAFNDGPAAIPNKAAPSSSTSGPGNYYAEDAGGKMLAELLRPSDPPPLQPTGPVASPRQFAPPRSLERPELPLPSSQASLPRLPLVLNPAPLRPRSLPEATPFSTHRNDPEPPRHERLLAGGRVRLPSPDVNQPIPLPTLAQPVTDRAPLDDPTGESSTRAALAAVPPLRSEPAPFVRMPLPDPFELQQTVRLRILVPEDPSPTASVSRPAMAK